jgi:hypothetical protein
VVAIRNLVLAPHTAKEWTVTRSTLETAALVSSRGTTGVGTMDAAGKIGVRGQANSGVIGVKSMAGCGVSGEKIKARDGANGESNLEERCLQGRHGREEEEEGGQSLKDLTVALWRRTADLSVVERVLLRDHAVVHSVITVLALPVNEEGSSLVVVVHLVVFHLVVVQLILVEEASQDVEVHLEAVEVHLEAVEGLGHKVTCLITR